MKTVTSFHLAIGLFIILSLALPLQQTQAQGSADLEPFETYSREELAQMLAPIALYPDALLSQILMASTYPIEVIEADRWVRINSQLKGEALNTALLDQSWDPSVKAICHFPSILALMSERITETTNLGNAFLAQEAEVMEMVQELRAKAHAQGNLTTTSQQRVIVEKETIIIQPADPRVIYVPYYDPFHVYGAWRHPTYRPHYWGPSGVRIGGGISYWPGIYFGFSFGTWSYFDWHLHSIYIDVHKRPRFVRHDRWIARSGHWHHAPRHRRGVAYRDKSIARKYGQYPHRPMDFRRSTRGFPNYQERKRVEFERSKLESAARTERERLRIARDKQKHKRAERDRQAHLKIKRESQEQERIELKRKKLERAARDKQKHERTERNRQEQPKIIQKSQKREPVKRDRQIQQQASQKKQKREQQPKSRDNVFNRVGDGRKERRSSKRGQVSRQGQSRDSRSKKSRSGSDDKGSRDDRIRNRK